MYEDLFEVRDSLLSSTVGFVDEIHRRIRQILKERKLTWSIQRILRDGTFDQ